MRRHSAYAIVLAVLALAGVASGGHILWNDPGTDNWNVGANWVGNAVPGTGDTAEIGAGEATCHHPADLPERLGDEHAQPLTRGGYRRAEAGGGGAVDEEVVGWARIGRPTHLHPSHITNSSMGMRPSGSVKGSPSG